MLGTLNNSGTINSSQMFEVLTGGTLTNTGTVTNTGTFQNSNVVTNSAVLTNKGTFNNSGQNVLLAINSGSTVNNAGPEQYARRELAACDAEELARPFFDLLIAKCGLRLRGYAGL